jgi:PmbA protein
MSTGTFVPTDTALRPGDAQRDELESLAAAAVAHARSLGATDAEAVVFEGDEFSVDVRMGEVEQLTESGSRAIGVRVFFASADGQRTASTSTSDLSAASLRQIVEGAVALAKITSPDPFAGLPAYEPASPTQSRIDEDLALYFDDVAAMDGRTRIEMAKRCEAAALASDPRIRNSRGASFNANTSRRVMVNSRGLLAGYRSSYAGFSVSPIAEDASGMQSDYWYSSARTTALLESPDEIGRIAAERALRKLGARRVATQQCSIVFPPEMARGLIGTMLAAANGDAIYRHASLFAGKLGDTVAGENITVIDDGRMVFDHVLDDGRTLRVGGFGTTPFDGDGLPTRRSIVIEGGVLRELMLNTYTARKLGMQSNGKATRGLAGRPGIGGGNYYLEPGTLAPEDILRDVQRGLYLTHTMGRGVNLVTGDYSVGAGGVWIENGELTHAVEEITIAGNLKDMFRNIVAIGNDLHFRSAGAAPTLRVEGMTIAGS